MKKLFLVMILLLAFTGTAFAAININTASQTELESLQELALPKQKPSLNIVKRMALCFHR